MYKPTKPFPFISLNNIFGVERTKEILNVNPTVPPSREDAKEVKVTIFDYSADFFEEIQSDSVEGCQRFNNNEHITWINVDGLSKKDVESLASQFGIHSLLVEDILSINQRPKMDEFEGVLFCVLNMLYFNKQNRTVEIEQISIVLGKDFVISFQEDPTRDVFDPVRHKLRIQGSNIRHRKSDYLLYTMIDLIVDNYFSVMELLSDEIEFLEEELIRRSTKRSLVKINRVRKELIVLKRNIAPVRDLVNGFIRSESDLLEDRTTKYFKDVYDHISQAQDLSENYRDMMMSMQDLYINNVNLKMNEVMKVMAVVTCLMAPATVIGGIFGMNFEVIPFAHQQLGFYSTVGAMIFIPMVMLIIFKRRGWF